MRRFPLAVVVVAVLLIRLEAQPSSSLPTLITSYSDGHYDEAVRQVAAIEDLGPFRLRYVQDVPNWVRSDPSKTTARRQAAAAFLLELTHARLESDWNRLADLIEFTCVSLRDAGPPDAFELAWDRASMALAGRARARLWLLGEFAQLPHQPPRKRPPPPPKEPSPYPQHLVHALARFPEDPQLRLDQILAWSWGRDQEQIRNVGVRWSADDPNNPFNPSLLLREAMIEYQVWTNNPTVGAEALMRIGVAQFTLGEHAASLGTLGRVQQMESAAPEIRYVSFFTAGRALEALKRRDEAMVEYAKALDVVPGAESASIALASLQFVSDDRDAAVARLADARTGRDAISDPGRITGYGSFMHWPALVRAMRAELGK
jgi:hypothetical protein